MNKDRHSVQLKPLTPEDHPVLITKPEFMRRMQEMQRLQGMGVMDMPEMHQLVINSNHPLIASKLLKMKRTTLVEKIKRLELDRDDEDDGGGLKSAVG